MRTDAAIHLLPEKTYFRRVLPEENRLQLIIDDADNWRADGSTAYATFGFAVPGNAQVRIYPDNSRVKSLQAAEIAYVLSFGRNRASKPRGCNVCYLHEEKDDGPRGRVTRDRIKKGKRRYYLESVEPDYGVRVALQMESIHKSNVMRIGSHQQ